MTQLLTLSVTITLKGMKIEEFLLVEQMLHYDFTKYHVLTGMKLDKIL